MAPGDLAAVCGYCGIKLLAEDDDALDPLRDMSCEVPEDEAWLPASPVPAPNRVAVGTELMLEEELEGFRLPM